MNTELQKSGEEAKQELSGFSINPESFEKAREICEYMAKSDFVPNDFKNKPGNIFVAVAMGAEVGLKPLQSLQSIAVINGRPTIWGDGLVALVRGSGLCEYLKDEWDEKTQTATCRGKRKDENHEIVKTFSLADAKTAGLAGNNTHSKYPKRMCEWRAKSWVIRAGWADVLKGIVVGEELQYEAIEAETVTDAIPAPRRLADPIEKEKQVEQVKQIKKKVAEEPEPEPTPEAPAVDVSPTKNEEPKELIPDESKTSNGQFDRSQMRIVVSTFKQVCAECKGIIEKGDNIHYSDVTKAKVHTKCPYTPE